MGIERNGGYSARVEIYLLVNGEKLRVAQVGPSTLILRDLRAIPPKSEGEVIIKVDDHDQRHHVFFYEGVPEGQELVNFW